MAVSNSPNRAMITPSVLNQAADNILALFRKMKIYSLGCVEMPFEQHAGEYLTARQFLPLAPAVVPLDDTLMDTEYVFAEYFDISIKMEQYSEVMQVPLKSQIYNQNDIGDAFSQLLGENMLLTEDSLMKQTLAACVNKLSAKFGNNGDFPTNLGVGDFSNAESFLANNDARRLFDSAEGEDRFATVPLGTSFLWLGSTKLMMGLRGLESQGFKVRENYADQNLAGAAEFGYCNGMRVWLSTNDIVIKNASRKGKDVYRSIAQGMLSTAKSKINEMAFHIYIRDPLTASRNMQFYEIGWMGFMGQGIINNEWVTAYDSTL